VTARIGTSHSGGGGSENELAALGELYARHAPGLRRPELNDVLLAAARAHRVLARTRRVG